MYFKPINIKKEEQEIFFSFISILKCRDMISQFFGSQMFEKIGVNNIFTIIKSKMREEMNFEEIIDFIASHFFEIESNMFDGIEYEFIDSILSSESLICNDEHSLFEFIVNLVRSRGSKYQGLFGRVIFSNLNESDLSLFEDIFDIDFIDQNIFSGLIQLGLKKGRHVNRYNISLARPVTRQQYEIHPIPLPPESSFRQEYNPRVNGNMRATWAVSSLDRRTGWN